MKPLPLSIPVRFCPSREMLATLNGREWCCSFSGGKDSTTLVTWLEWLRRVGMVQSHVTPRLVQSDTEVEYPFLGDISSRVTAALVASGWECEKVRPRIHEKLYNRIFGIGNVPVHPGNKKRMRWCTRSTKIDPMLRRNRRIGPNVLQLSGVRFGESVSRDAKLRVAGCSAGGECGLPDVSERVQGPIIDWKLCKVIEWLNGEMEQTIRDMIPDLLPLMRDLVNVYEVTRKEEYGFWEMPPKITAARFGCIGCPAISNEKITKSREGKRHPEWAGIRRIYGIWDQCYRRMNRCVRTVNGKDGYGPLRMEARKRLFAEFLEIQRDIGIVLVTPEDIAFIHKCWADKRYPRGWSEASSYFLRDQHEQAQPRTPILPQGEG